MALDDRYITSVSLDPSLIDKDTATALANGKVYFYRDDNRLYPKTVFQLTGSAPNYTYTALPNPIDLNAKGAFQDDNGNDIAVYYFPYDEFGNIENYYVVATDTDGIEQFTREAWPNLSAGTAPAGSQNVGLNNEISNGQFADIFFDPTKTLTVSFTGTATDSVDIAPDWTLQFTHTGAANVQITRTSLSGSQLIPTNPPYSLTIVPSANITSLKLIQKLNHNTDIWSPVIAEQGGFVNAGILLGTATQNLTLQYSPQAAGTTQSLGTFSNNLGEYFYFNETTQLIVADNTNTSDAGFVYFVIDLDTSSTSIISSVQLMGLDSSETSLPYQQQTVNRQKDQLFHFYQNWLNAKPIPSYLTGWDFPLNPAQISGSTVAAAGIGANKSQYTWDQTIIFQSANTSVGVTRAAGTGDFVITAAATTQPAIIQYLDATQARRLLSNKIAVNFSAFSDNASGLIGTVSLWATDDASLPVVAAGTNNSIVLTLDANGKPATKNGAGWIEVPRGNLGDASFTLSSALTEYNFRGWDMSGNALVTTANFFAIVIGFASLANTKKIDFQYAALCSGDIATRPAPLTPQETLRDCEQYYEQSYDTTHKAADISTTDSITKIQGAQVLNGGGSGFRLAPFDIEYRTIKRSNIPNIAIYSPSAGTVSLVDATITTTNQDKTNSATVNISNWTASFKGNKVVTYIPNATGIGPAVTASGDVATNIPFSFICFHYVIDARLGIV